MTDVVMTTHFEELGIDDTRKCLSLLLSPFIGMDDWAL